MKPTLIDHPSMSVRVLITDCPPSEQLLRDEYVPVFEEQRVAVLIRLCEPTYDTSVVENAGVKVVDSMAFTDGSSPPPETLAEYRRLLDALASTNTDSRATVAVHCVSGIGRAPLFALIPLVDAGMERTEAVEYIRQRRRGAFNKVQLAWIMDERTGLTKLKKQNTGVAMFLGRISGGSSNNVGKDDRRTSVTSVTSDRNSVASSRKKGGAWGLFGKKA